MSNTRDPVNTTEEALDAIRGEREYQNLRWNEANISSGGQHSLEEFIVYIEAYLIEMKIALSHSGDDATQEKMQGQMRKVATMAVACMEQNGVVVRNQSEIDALRPVADEEIPF